MIKKEEGKRGEGRRKERMKICVWLVLWWKKNFVFLVVAIFTHLLTPFLPYKLLTPFSFHFFSLHSPLLPPPRPLKERIPNKARKKNPKARRKKNPTSTMSVLSRDLADSLFSSIIADNLPAMLSLGLTPRELASLRHPSSGLSPLHVAAFAGADACLRALLEGDQGGELLALKADDSFTAAHYAAHEGHLRYSSCSSSKKK